MQWKTFIESDVPRVNCPSHGVKQVRVSWAEDQSRFTALFEAFTIDVLMAVRSKVQAEQLTGISWDQEDQVMSRAVAVGMDMWPSFMEAKADVLPQAEVVHDKFHVVRELTRAVDTVRKAEHQQLKRDGQPDVFKKKKYLCLKNPENWTENQRAHFESLKIEALQVGRAWSIKEAFEGFWEYRYAGSARKFFDRWYFWAAHSRLPAVIEAARTRGILPATVIPSMRLSGFVTPHFSQ